MKDAAAGGIEFTFQGTLDALKAHGVLFDEKGYSAEIDFSRFEQSPESTTYALRTPRFAVGAADPRLGLPANTVFEPTVALHNFNPYPLDVQLTLRQPDGSPNNAINIPIQLPPENTDVIPLQPYIGVALPNFAPWSSLEVDYTDAHNGVAGAMVSVTQEGKHSIRSVLNAVEGSNREGWYWRVDADHDTLLSILNADAQDAHLKISLDYYISGQAQSWELPERILGPHASTHVDIGEFIAAGQLDAHGHLPPLGVPFGGYHVRKIGPRVDKTLTTETLVFDRREQSFLTFYNTCCGYTGPFVVPGSFLGSIGFIGTGQVEATDYCSGTLVDFTASSTFSSQNTTVATVDTAFGVTGQAPGSTNINSCLTYSKQRTVDTCVTGTFCGNPGVTVCDFALSPEGPVTAAHCDGTTSNNQLFGASAIPPGCSVIPSQSTCSGFSSGGSVSVQGTTTNITSSSANCTVMYTASGASGQSAGRVGLTMKLAFYPSSVVVFHTVRPSVTCP